MSSSIRAEAEIILKADRFKSSAQDAKRDLKEVGAAGQQSMSQVKAGADNAAQGMTNLDTKTKSAGNSMGSMAATAAKAGGSIIGMTANITGAVYAFQDLEDINIKVKQSALAVSKAQEEVDKQFKDGGASSLNYKQAVDKLTVAQLKQGEVAEDAQRQNVQFATQMVTMAVTTVPSFIASLVSLKAAHFAGAGASAIAAGAHGGFTASIVAGTASIWANTVALLSNPIFAAAAAASIAAAVALIATNQWGLRDAIFGSTEAVKQSTTALKEGAPALENYGDAAKTATEDVTAFGAGLNKMSSAMDILSFSLKGAGQPAADFMAIWKQAKFDAHESAKSIDEATTSIQKFSAAFSNSALKKNDKNLIESIEDFTVRLGFEAIAANLIEYENTGDKKYLTTVNDIESKLRTITSKTGKIRSISEQMLAFGNRSSTFTNIGGGVGNLFGNIMSASALTGLQAKDTLGILNIASLGTARFTNTGELSARLSNASVGKSGSGKSVAAGGSRSAGRSSKHGGANRATNYQRLRAQKSVVSEDRENYLKRVTGMSLEFPRWWARYRGDSHPSWNEAFVMWSAQVAEAESRVSLANELFGLGGIGNETDISMGFDGSSAASVLSLSSDEIRNRIATERQTIQRESYYTNIEESQILKLRRTSQGTIDIAGITKFNQREMLFAHKM